MKISAAEFTANSVPPFSERTAADQLPVFIHLADKIDSWPTAVFSPQNYVYGINS